MSKIDEETKSELIQQVLEPMRKTIKQIAEERCPKDLKNQHLCRVQLISEVLKALRIFLNQVSAEALHAGAEIAEIGATIGGSQNQSNVRRKLPQMKVFENAITEANERKKPVNITINGWKIQVSADERSIR